MWNQYKISKKKGVIQHKCDGCNDPADKLYQYQGSNGNDYRKLHDSHTYYCDAKNKIIFA